MNYIVLFSLLLVHALSDFVFQSPKILQKRTGLSLKEIFFGNLEHIFYYFLISIIPLLFFWSGYRTLIIVLSLVVIHGLIDFSKSLYIYIRQSARYSMLLFLFDQFLHLVSIVIASYIISLGMPFNPVIVTAAAGGIEACKQMLPAYMTAGDKWILAAFLLVIGLWGTGIFIRQFLDSVKYRTADSPTVESCTGETNKSGVYSPDGGFIIGILERLFIILAIVLGREEVIGFVLATKSIARFKKFNEDCFMEYFIIGSFLSFIVAIGVGVVIRGLNLIQAG